MNNEKIEVMARALGRLLETEGTNSKGEYICYCDDYTKPEICAWCEALKALCAYQEVKS